MLEILVREIPYVNPRTQTSSTRTMSGTKHGRPRPNCSSIKLRARCDWLHVVFDDEAYENVRVERDHDLAVALAMSRFICSTVTPLIWSLYSQVA